ncbi:Delta-aminolevulinic acid dehydratase [Lecanosticta acicola]|uniref:Delta-aminolevulinic acid dehydratase n=1 Tax=Lecanosticta acicola TaxID=111012 RepID=A0AAI8YYQ3_9PEZI|nr:Delta-aminolevulinic acid dehydratase [Lecanosticta acicola]
MTTEEGLRRSGRARKQVETYAEGPAEQENITAAAAPKKNKASRKKRIKAEVEEEDDEHDDDFVDERPKKRGKLTFYPVPPKKTGKSAHWKDTSWMSNVAEQRVAREQAPIPKLGPGKREERLRSYIDGVPEWYQRFLQSASTQKMFILDRMRDVEQDCHAHHDDCPFEALTIAGSSGNVYRVRISHITSCTCPVGNFAKKGEVKQCKHVLYVLHHVLKAPEHLKFQPAFLTAELRELFTHAGPLPEQIVEEQASEDGNRKSLEDAECPICYMEWTKDDEIVWCKAACGNNLHKGCFQQWAQIKANVTCPLCRTPWQENDNPGKQKATVVEVGETTGHYGSGGYRNVRDQLEYD